MHFEDIPKGKFFKKENRFSESVNDSIFCTQCLHKDRCAKNSSPTELVTTNDPIKNWTQRNPKEFRARAVLHHIGVQNAASLIVCGRLEFQMDEFSTAQN